MSSCFDITVTPPPPRPILLVAAAVLVDPDGRVLIGSRPEGKAYAGWWEFPGGKLEKDETPEWALVRELNEELGITTKPTCLSPLTFVSYTYADLGLHILMPVYVCRHWQGMMQPREGQELRWIRVSELGQYRFVPGSVPILPYVQDHLR